MSKKSEELLAKMSSHLPTKVDSTLSAEPKTEDVDIDYEYSREKYKRLVDKGTDAIDHMMELALQSDHPRAYEVLGGMLKNVSDMTDKLMSLHNNVEKVKSAKSTPNHSGVGTLSSPSVTNNNVFVGSTTDLQRFIIAQQQKVDVIESKPSED